MAHLGTPTVIADAAGAMLLVSGCLLLPRVSTLEAASVVCLIGVAGSAHAWGYDAVLALPAIFYGAAYVPRSTWLLIAAYVIAAFSLYSMWVHFNAVTVVVLGGTAIWFAGVTMPARNRPVTSATSSGLEK